ncbi:MAG TPA: oligogalacturonate lyase family protein [Candidatus Hydrogenedentes bacterium]|nr:oligogalacturonate lyase family protein [Candidatus Hydrogenedentota bacterium]
MGKTWISFFTIVLLTSLAESDKPGAWPPETPVGNEWIDQHTGHRVIRLSRREGNNEVFYFHQNPFTASGDKMVFMGLTQNGRNVFTVDLKTLEIRQITTISTGFEVVAPKSCTLYYMSGDKVYSTNIDSLETREIATVPHHYTSGRGLSVNSDETLLAGCYCLGEEKYYTSKMPRKQWIREIWKAKLPNALYTIDIKSGKVCEIYRENEWLGHVQFSPTDPNLIEFCHEGPSRDVERMWMIRSDGTGLKKLHEKKWRRELQTHEFWSPDGKKVWCDFQTPRWPVKIATFMEKISEPRFYLASIDVQTLELKKYPFNMRYASRHFNISPDQTMFCGDGEGGSFRLCPSGKWIFLYRFDHGKLHVEKLCSMAGHSWSYYPEPNTHFTPDGQWVVFQSDVGGTLQVYAVEVKPAQ